MRTSRLSENARGDCGYCIDETGFALQLVAEGKHHSPSRPWRCGKDLFVDTLKEFLGGMVVEPHSDWPAACPVGRLDFGVGRVGQHDRQHETCPTS